MTLEHADADILSEHLIPVGARIDRTYTVEAHLSRGGKSSVYRATYSGNVYAVKVLSANDLTSFNNEAEISKRVTNLDNRYIVKVIHTGIDRDRKFPYIVMEYLLHSQDLQEYVLDQPGGYLPRDHAFYILDCICRALGDVHDQQIAHGDLHLGNVLVVPDERETPYPFVVKLIDFGSARTYDPLHRRRNPKRSDTVHAEQSFLAPERASGNRPTPQGDVWALGLLAFFMLTGTMYWTPEEPKNPSQPPSTRARHYRCERRIPARFDTWFMRCLAPVESHRFSNAKDAYDQLLAMTTGVTKFLHDLRQWVFVVTHDPRAASMLTFGVLGLVVGLVLGVQMHGTAPSSAQTRDLTVTVAPVPVTGAIPALASSVIANAGDQATLAKTARSQEPGAMSAAASPRPAAVADAGDAPAPVKTAAPAKAARPPKSGPSDDGTDF